MYSSRIFLDHAGWLDRSGQVLMTWSIFNPWGPTVECVGLADTPDENVKDVFWRWFNWTDHQAYSFGRIDQRSTSWDEDLKLMLSARFGADEVCPPGLPMLTCIPSIVTFADGGAAEHLGRYLFPQAGVFATRELPAHVYRHAKYGAHLFDRVTEELHGPEEAARRHGPRAEPVLPEFKSKTELIERWLADVTDVDFVAGATVQLAVAWVGAINNVPDADGSSLLKARYEDLTDFFRHFQHPFLLEMPTPEIESRFGVGRDHFRSGKKEPQST